VRHDKFFLSFLFAKSPFPSKGQVLKIDYMTGTSQAYFMKNKKQMKILLDKK